MTASITIPCKLKVKEPPFASVRLSPDELGSLLLGSPGYVCKVAFNETDQQWVMTVELNHKVAAETPQDRKQVVDIQ